MIAHSRPMGPTMDITTVSAMASQIAVSDTTNAVQVAVLKKAMNQEASVFAQLFGTMQSGSSGSGASSGLDLYM